MVKTGWLYISYFFAYLSVYFGSILIPSLPTTMGWMVEPFTPTQAGWAYTANTTYTSAMTSWGGMSLLTVSAVVIGAVITIGILLSGFTMKKAVE